MHVRKTILCVLIALLAACAEQGPGPIVSSGSRYAVGTDITSDYRLGVGDRVKITVFNEQTLSGEYPVGANGTISLPLIGAVKATGRTIGEVSGETEDRLRDGFLRSPNLTAEVTVYRPFYILGEVGNPGQYPYAVGMTVTNAVALARGFSTRADRDVVRIRRQGDKDEVSYRLTPELLIYPGDSVRVGERFF